MTRFMKELSGDLGAYWQDHARREVEAVAAELEAGEITIDEAGVARNCIGRVLMSDMVEKLTLVTNKVNVAATEAARSAEASEAVKSYQATRKPHSAEEIAEMRAAFGAGTTVVDVLTGEQINL